MKRLLLEMALGVCFRPKPPSAEVSVAVDPLWASLLGLQLSCDIDSLRDLTLS